MLVAVKHYGLNLQLASPELRADKEVVLAAIEQDPYAWCHADKELKRAIDRHPDVRAARAQTPEEATALLKQIERRRTKNDEELDVLDTAVAIISRRFCSYATVQDAAAEASARLHNPRTKSGRVSAVGKRNRASYEAAF